MLTENTVTKLQEMHLSAMAKAFKDQLSDPNMADMSFEDRFGLIVDHEWTTRKNNHLNRLIKSAGFAEPNACVEDIEYHADRNLDKAQIARLASCDYITDHHNVMLLGATGSGKTYLACAFGMAAVRNFLTVKYVRLPELLTELAIARSNGTYRKVIQQYKRPALLILDDFLLHTITDEREVKVLFEILEKRSEINLSTIICSQREPASWSSMILNDEVSSNAIMKRATRHYTVVIKPITTP